MFLWKMICALWDLCWQLEHWRLNVSFGGGVILAVAVLAAAPNSRFIQILAGIVFAGCLVGGWIWDDRGTSG
jgi:hypothetical protein